MKLKLATDLTPQHIFIMTIGGAIFALNMIMYFKASSREKEAQGETKVYTSSYDEMTGETNNVETRYENPKLTWYQSLFCRGFQRSTESFFGKHVCSLKTLHPLEDEMISQGIEVPEGEAEQKGAIYFKGNIKKNSSFSSLLKAPEEETVEPKIQAYN